MHTRANRQPALAAYGLDAATGTRRAWCVFVLTIEGASIAELTAFLDPTLFPVFGLPMDLER